MTIDYCLRNGAIGDGCSVPLLRAFPKIYISNVPYGGVIEDSIAVGFYEYRAVFQLRAGLDVVSGASS